MSPRTIVYGEMASVYIGVRDLESWRQIAEGPVKHCEVKSLDKVRVEVCPTVGSAVRVVPDKKVLDFLGPFFEGAKQALQDAE